MARCVGRALSNGEASIKIISMLRFIALFLGIMVLGSAFAVPDSSVPNRWGGSPGASEIATQQVQAFARRLTGDSISGIKTPGALQVHILACIGFNGAYEVRELVSTPLNSDGTFKIKKKEKDYEIIAEGKVSLDGKIWLFEGSSDVKMEIPPDRAPPSGQKPHIQMGTIRTYISLGKPKYFAGAQAGEVKNVAGVSNQSGFSLDLFVLAH